MHSISENEHIIHLWNAMAVSHWFIATGILIVLFIIFYISSHLMNSTSDSSCLCISYGVSIISFTMMLIYGASCLETLSMTDHFFHTTPVDYAKQNIQIIKNQRYNIKHHSKLSIKYEKKYHEDDHGSKIYLANSYKALSDSESQTVLDEHYFDMNGLHKVKSPTFKNYVIPQYFHK